MPTYQFEAMDATGQEIRDEVEAPTQEEAQATIRQMGYFVTKISVKKGEPSTAAGRRKKKKSFVMGGASGKEMVTFTKQLSVLQDAGLPILRSLRILEGQARPGALKNALIDVCDDIEGGSTLSEAMGKCPKVFNRLYVNMIKAGEAGGALETILRRLAEFMERARSLRNKVIGAMIYPAAVITFAVLIVLFIMIWIVPEFDKIFQDFGLTLPLPTQILIMASRKLVKLWFLIPGIPIVVVLFIMLVKKFKAGRMGWHQYLLKLPLFGKLIEKNILARTTRTLGTLVASGVPILEALAITRETSNNGMFEKMFGKVTEAIREGETIAQPMKQHSRPGFHPVALFFWMASLGFPWLLILAIDPEGLWMVSLLACLGGMVGGAATYLLRYNGRVVEDMVVNMVDVGEESGELDTMLYKVADYYDEEVATLTEGLLKLIEPLLIVFLGVTIGFIVISLFVPLISLITSLTEGGAK